jgi:hypothetical protein
MIIDVVFNRRTLPAFGLAVTTLLLNACSATPLPRVTPVPVASAEEQAPAPTLSASFFAASCAQDAEVDATKRNMIVRAGVTFMEALLGKDPASAFDLFSKEEQTEITRSQLVEMAMGFHKLLEPKGLTVEHTYLIRMKGQSPERVVCAKDLSRPDGWSSVKVTSTPEQAYVLASANSQNESLAVTIWLVPEDGLWKIHAFSIFVSSLGRQDAGHILELARTQQALGHHLNALLLHYAAASISGRGPLLELGTMEPISAEYFKAQRPAEMAGTPPWYWRNDGGSFKVVQIGSLGIAGKIYVVIDHEVPSKTSNEDMVRVNRDLIAYFKNLSQSTLMFLPGLWPGLMSKALTRGTIRWTRSLDETRGSPMLARPRV